MAALSMNTGPKQQIQGNSGFRQSFQRIFRSQQKVTLSFGLDHHVFCSGSDVFRVLRQQSHVYTNVEAIFIHQMKSVNLQELFSALNEYKRLSLVTLYDVEKIQAVSDLKIPSALAALQLSGYHSKVGAEIRTLFTNCPIKEVGKGDFYLKITFDRNYLQRLPADGCLALVTPPNKTTTNVTATATTSGTTTNAMATTTTTTLVRAVALKPAVKRRFTFEVESLQKDGVGKTTASAKANSTLLASRLSNPFSKT